MVLAEGVLIILVHSKLSGNGNVSGKLTCSAEAGQAVFCCLQWSVCVRGMCSVHVHLDLHLLDPVWCWCCLAHTLRSVSDLYSFSASCTVCVLRGRGGLRCFNYEERTRKKWNAIIPLKSSTVGNSVSYHFVTSEDKQALKAREEFQLGMAKAEFYSENGWWM